MTHPVLDGLTVLELSAGSQAAALAGVLLADNGTRVIKVEPPEGDRLPSTSPTVDHPRLGALLTAGVVGAADLPEPSPEAVATS